MNRVLISFIIVSISNVLANPVPHKCSRQNIYRLPGNVKPSLYSINIRPDIDKETFTGEVNIHVEALFAVKSIDLHSSHTHLKISAISLNSKKVDYIPELCHCNSPWDELGYEFLHRDIVSIKYLKEILIPPGKHIIGIKYSGVFSKTTEGIFKTGFTKNGTTLSHLVATDLEPSLARQVFPCFDEPAFKAKFQLSLVVPNNSYTALSNTNVIEKFPVTNGVLYIFGTTPLMSTYLLSFAISEHTYFEYVDDTEVPYRLYTYNGSEEKIINFLKFTSQVIKFYSNYTGFDYTLPKIDFIEYDRFESLGTENWGLVTLNTSLVSSNDVYDDNQRWTIIAHEMAHFWFGNLVTNAWWDDIWLQEGLATFMSIKAEEHILQNNASKFFPSQYQQDLLWFENGNTSTPVINFQVIPEKIRENFNDITYNKAAAILRMLEMVIGEDKLREAILSYICTYAFKVASTEDFLEIIETFVPNKNLRRFLESYLYQEKYPVVHVQENEDYYILKQRSCGEKPSSNKWTFPVTYTSDLNKKPNTVWFDKNRENLSIPKGNTTWIKFNYRQVGYYRVHYSRNMWEVLIEHNQELEPYERDSLLLEAQGSFEMDLISCDIVLKYLLELACNVTKERPFNIEYGFIVYEKLGQIIAQFDKDAVKSLKEFVRRALYQARKKRDMYRSYHTDDEITEKKMTESIKSCLNWLKYNSTEYLESHLPVVELL